MNYQTAIMTILTEFKKKLASNKKKQGLTFVKLTFPQIPQIHLLSKKTTEENSLFQKCKFFPKFSLLFNLEKAFSPGYNTSSSPSAVMRKSKNNWDQI